MDVDALVREAVSAIWSLGTLPGGGLWKAPEFIQLKKACGERYEHGKDTFGLTFALDHALKSLGLTTLYQTQCKRETYMDKQDGSHDSAVEVIYTENPLIVQPHLTYIVDRITGCIIQLRVMLPKSKPNNKNNPDLNLPPFLLKLNTAAKHHTPSYSL